MYLQVIPNKTGVRLEASTKPILCTHLALMACPAERFGAPSASRSILPTLQDVLLDYVAILLFTIASWTR